MLNKISDFFKALFQKDSSLKIISILCAIMIWMFVSISLYPTIDKVIYNVPVTIDLENTRAQAEGLEVISMSDRNVTVSIRGERGQIGDLKSENLTAQIDVSNVNVPREYSLGMNIQSESGKSFDVIEITPPSVTVLFDRIISREFEIKPRTEGISIAAGYTGGDPVVTPEKVTITAPENTINSITDVYAEVQTEAELDTTYEFTTSELVLQNGNAIISNENKLISFDKTLFAVQVPVFVRKTLPLEVNIINAPENFDLEYFRKQLVFSIDELTIAAPNDKIRELTSLNIGTINMREVDKGSVFEFKTENFLTSDFDNLTQTDVVTVTCPSDGIAKKAIPIKGKDIQFVNKPAQFDFVPVASGMTLILVGDEKDIAELTAADITAQIDLIDFDMQEGDHKMAVDFLISSYSKVWFNGDNGIATPKIYVTATLKSPSED